MQRFLDSNFLSLSLFLFREKVRWFILYILYFFLSKLIHRTPLLYIYHIYIYRQIIIIECFQMALFESCLSTFCLMTRDFIQSFPVLHIIYIYIWNCHVELLSSLSLAKIVLQNIRTIFLEKLRNEIPGDLD